MKRYVFLTMIFLAMVVAIFLASCQPAPAVVPVATPAPDVPATQPDRLPETRVVEQPKPTATATSLPAQVIPVTAPVEPTVTADAEVYADVLNVRVGPGMNHRIMAQLTAGQIVRMEGRSHTGEWVAVLLPDGKEGWVYASYLSYSGDLAALPILEAYGGPLPANVEPQPTSKPGKRYRLNVSIAYNQVEIVMAGFAAERDVTLRLAANGGDLAMAVATTTTDAQGGASLAFAMPTNWPDGSLVTQSEMELQVLDSDGTLLGKAKIAYQSGW